nr:alpha-N-acetylgalactosaminide alpha-2,6-sialyltransferase 1 isoform X1 [Pogona vitticeps]
MKLMSRSFRRVSKWLLIIFLFLILSFAAHIGFTEKYPYRQFFYFCHLTAEEPVEGTQQATPGAVTASQETSVIWDRILGSGNSRLKQDAVKRLVAHDESYAQEKPDTLRVSPKSPKKQTRNERMISEANKKATEEKFSTVSNKIKPKDRSVTPLSSQRHADALDSTARTNKKQDGRIAMPIIKTREEKRMTPESQRERQPEAKYVTPTSNTKQSEEKEVGQAFRQHLEGINVTPSSKTEHADRKQSRKRGTTKEHSYKVESVPTIVHHNASAPWAQHVTHLVPVTPPKNRFKASDFTSEPHWDFDDQYLQDASTPHSSCPDSLRVKAAKSDQLKGLFLSNITLFMDRTHFRDSEWERLEHFLPPFGFMDLNYSLVKEVINMLPPKPYHQILLAQKNNQPSRCVTCAVVGNGGILNNSRMGQEIDSHDYVFRVSGAVTKGYEKDVGARTSFYGFTAYSLVASLGILRNRGFRKIPMGEEIKYFHFLEGERDYEWLKALLLNTEVRKGFLDYYGPRPRDNFDNFSLDKYFVIHPDFIRYMKNRFLRSKSLDSHYWRIYRPTTGAFLLLTALHLCDQVSAYGYITEGYQKYSDHYYDKEWKRLIFYVNHDFGLEKRMWKKLHDEQIMKLYQRL